MEFISLPPCNDTIASHIFWIFLVTSLVGAGIHGFFKKFDMFDEEIRLYVVGIAAVLFAGWCLFNTLYIEFRGISIGKNVVELHYLWPRSPIVIDAASIDDVDIGTELQLYRPTRQWKHDLVIRTNQKKSYQSVDVCMPKSMSPVYLEAIYTRVNDSVERAEEAVALCALKAKFESGRAASPCFLNVHIPTVCRELNLARWLDKSTALNCDVKYVKEVPNEQKTDTFGNLMFARCNWLCSIKLTSERGSHGDR
jgi:hypothetical protein